MGNQNLVNKARSKVTQRAAQQRGARPDSAPKVLSWAPNPGALEQGTTSEGHVDTLSAVGVSPSGMGSSGPSRPDFGPKMTP